MGEFLYFSIYVLQQLGVMLAVGAQTVLLCTHLLSMHRHEHENPHASYARAARVALSVGFFLMIVSGLLAVGIHLLFRQFDVLLAPAFLFKWVLIVGLLVLFLLQKWFVRQINSYYAFAGASVYALFLVHSLGPVTTWLTLVTLYAVWLAFFAMVWGFSVALMRWHVGPRRMEEHVEEEEAFELPPPPPRPKPKVPSVPAPQPPLKPIVVAPPPPAPKPVVVVVPPPPPPPAPKPAPIVPPPPPPPVVAPPVAPPPPQPVVPPPEPAPQVMQGPRISWWRRLFGWGRRKSPVPQVQPQIQPQPQQQAPLPQVIPTLQVAAAPPPPPPPAPKPAPIVPPPPPPPVVAPPVAPKPIPPPPPRVVQPAPVVAPPPVSPNPEPVDERWVPALRLMPQKPEDIGKQNRPPVVKLSDE